jgi:hypothetical protein
MVEELRPTLGVRCTLRKQRSRFDSGQGLVRSSLLSIHGWERADVSNNIKRCCRGDV